MPVLNAPEITSASGAANGNPGSGVMQALALLAVGCAVVAATPARDYPALHGVLDASMFLTSGVLALLLWEMGGRTKDPLPRLVAVCFAAVSLLELVPAAAALEWASSPEESLRLAALWRPATWGAATYLLPISIGTALWLLKLPQPPVAPHAIAQLTLGAALVALFIWLPRYADRDWLGASQPTVYLIPILWLSVGTAAWHMRARHRILPAVAMMSLILLLSHGAMLFSHAPTDGVAVCAHFGKLVGRLYLLLLLTQLTTLDTAHRLRVERELQQANDMLADRVRERTAELERTNAAMRVERSTRELAERKTHTQLERLSQLQQITRAIGERQDLDSIFHVVVGSLEDHLRIDLAGIWLCDPVGKVLVLNILGPRSAPVAKNLGFREREPIDIGQSGMARCLQGELIYEPDTAAIAAPLTQRLAGGGLRALVASPLRVENRTFAVLITARREANAFSSSDCEFLAQLSEHTALAAHQAQLHATLQQAYDDLRTTQRAVMEQERLRALGEMASGIAHDINNAISPISLYAGTLLESEGNLSARGRDQLATIARAIDDVAATVSRLRKFYREREPQSALGPVDLPSLIDQVIELTRARWHDMPQQHGAVIDVSQERTPDLPLVAGIESEIREALTNLIFNSVDAMPAGGSITLRTAVLHEPGGRRRVQLQVADSGLGMDDATRRRCLEPFFTTKGDRGTGLGLPMVHGVMQRHGGDMVLESSPGKGTTIRLIFSIQTTGATGALASESPAKVRPGLRILVVDDDPALLESLREALELDGHRVAAAEGGGAGIERFNAALQAGEPFDIAITDLGMPYVDGRQVALALKSASPATPVLMLTGWGQRLMTEGDTPAHVDRVFSKPPKLAELRAALAHFCHL